MKEKFEALKTWVMNNKVIAAVAGLVVLVMIYKKFGKKTYRRRRSLPRSVNYPVRRKRAGSTSRRSGAKKPWQIKGSPAARRRMALLRRKRNR